MSTLQYYFEDGSHVIFNKYAITNGVISNKKTGKVMSYFKNKSGYNACKVVDDYGKRRPIQVGRAIASSKGPPPTLQHTADHIDRNPDNDTDDNIRWLCRIGQRNNQERAETSKSAFIISKDGVEKTVKEWVVHLKPFKNHVTRDYTEKMIKHYAQKNQHGFSYKEYEDLPSEIWKEIVGSSTTRGRWEISNMCRVKYVTKFAKNVISRDRLGLSTNGYPKVSINGKNMLCHVLSFVTFFPEEYNAKKDGDMVLHKDDDKTDFSPHKLRLGTPSENGNDAHDNGKYDGAQTERMRCVSYINNIFEKEHESQCDAARYLKLNGYPNANYTSICRALSDKYKQKTAYDRTWKLC